jgi:hypothetical protein
MSSGELQKGEAKALNQEGESDFLTTKYSKDANAEV